MSARAQPVARFVLVDSRRGEPLALAAAYAGERATRSQAAFAAWRETLTLARRRYSRATAGTELTQSLGGHHPLGRRGSIVFVTSHATSLPMSLR